MTTDRRKDLFDSLGKSKAHREAFVHEHIATGVAFQIRELREARSWTQAQLGQEIERPQEWISTVENPDKGSYTLKTLERIASAFDVGLEVRFVSFSDLVDRTVRLSPDDFVPPNYVADSISLAVTVDASLLAATSLVGSYFIDTTLYVGSTLGAGATVVGSLTPTGARGRISGPAGETGRSNQYALAA